jgi:hypothetical protein
LEIKKTPSIFTQCCNQVHPLSWIIYTIQRFVISIKFK